MNLTIIFLIIVVLLLIYSFVFHKKRSTKIEKIAPKLGFAEIEREKLVDRLGELDDFLYPNGVSCELKDGEERKRKIGFRSGWCASRSIGDLSLVDLSISSRYYDSTASSQGGSVDSLDRETRKYGMSLTQTVVFFHLKGASLPRFLISERLPFNNEYVSVNGSEQIGEHYRICALDVDKAKVQCLIGDKILEILDTERLWSIESHKDRVSIYQKNWLAPASKFEALIKTATEIVEELLDNSEESIRQKEAR